MDNKVKIVEQLTVEDAYNNLVYCVDQFFKGGTKECGAMIDSLKLIRNLIGPKVAAAEADYVTEIVEETSK